MRILNGILIVISAVAAIVLLPMALWTAFMTMGQVAAQEWRILELEFGRPADG